MGDQRDQVKGIQKQVKKDRKKKCVSEQNRISKTYFKNIKG
jgi:hypothetical protein